MINAKIRIHFILEGYEENALFELIEHFYKKDNIEMTYKNCEGGGTVPAFYQDALASDDYDLIYCVYDVDFKPNDNKAMYKIIRAGLFKVLGDENEVDKVSLCTNPNTLLLILLGYTNLSNLLEIKADKKSNTKLISKYCEKIGNKKDYDASDWQLELFKNDYLYNNIASFDKMFESCEAINEDYKGEIVGSNALPIIRALIMGDYDFFERIMKGE